MELIHIMDVPHGSGMGQSQAVVWGTPWLQCGTDTLHGGHDQGTPPWHLLHLLDDCALPRLPCSYGDKTWVMVVPMPWTLPAEPCAGSLGTLVTGAWHGCRHCWLCQVHGSGRVGGLTAWCQWH